MAENLTSDVMEYWLQLTVFLRDFSMKMLILGRVVKNSILKTYPVNIFI